MAVELEKNGINGLACFINESDSGFYGFGRVLWFEC